MGRPQGEFYKGAVGGMKTSVSATFTRPADGNAYAANDVVSNSTSASTLMVFTDLLRVRSGAGYVVGARLSTNKKSITPRFRIHLFNASDPTRAADNAQWKEAYADYTKRLGYFDLTAMTTAADAANSDMSRAFDLNLRIPVKAADGSSTIYALLETLDAFTPSSGQAFALTLLAETD